MKYILKIYHKSKYFGFEREEYKEFDTYEQIMLYVSEKKICYENYEIYGRVILWKMKI